MQIMQCAKAASLAAIALLVACHSQQPEEAESNLPASKPVRRPPLPVFEPPFNRARLLLTVARAASSRSIGADDSEAQRMLDGKQFEVRLRFGCDGPAPGPSNLGWSIDPNGRTLRLRAVPTLSLDDDLVRAVAGDRFEAAEGFWLSRPWVLNAACPAATPAAESATTQPREAAEQVVASKPPLPDAPQPAVQRIGIAQFFSSEDSRTGRRLDRPFEAVRPLKEGERAGEQGFNLVLSGRLRAREDGRVILCVAAAQDRPPDCVISASVDRVLIERPEDKAVMAEWSTLQ